MSCVASIEKTVVLNGIMMQPRRASDKDKVSITGNLIVRPRIYIWHEASGLTQYFLPRPFHLFSSSSSVPLVVLSHCHSRQFQGRGFTLSIWYTVRDSASWSPFSHTHTVMQESVVRMPISFVLCLSSSFLLSFLPFTDSRGSSTPLKTGWRTG